MASLAERAQLARLIAGIRWAGVALAVIEAVIADPAPISRALFLAVAALMAAYNVPATFAPRLPDRWVERVLLLALAGDAAAISSFLLLSTNDPHDLTFITYFLVAVEAAVVYQLRAAIAVSVVAVTTIVGGSVVAATAFHIDSDVGNLVLRCTIVALAFVFLGQIAQTSEDRRALALRQSARNEALHTVASRLSRTLKQDYVLETVVDSLGRLYPQRWHAILLRDEEGILVVKHVRGTPDHIALTIRRPEAYEAGPILFHDIRTDERIARIRGDLPDELFEFAGGVAVPLRTPERLFGILATFDRRPGAFSADEVGFLDSLAHHASLALENARLYEEVQMLSLTDATTALFNRRAFDLRLRDELERATRYQLPLALLMIDVDHFKLYNDTHGHPAGDKVLRALGDVLAGSELRATDTAFRFGGEEFAVILPHTDAAAALNSAERVRAAVEQAAFPEGTDQPLGRVTISIGIATFPAQAGDARDLVSRADLALYEAKRLGRNRVVSFVSQLQGESATSTL
jgi:diguanylate cyclase (GGDEF)-like protein